MRQMRNGLVGLYGLMVCGFLGSLVVAIFKKLGARQVSRKGQPSDTAPTTRSTRRRLMLRMQRHAHEQSRQHRKNVRLQEGNEHFQDIDK